MVTLRNINMWTRWFVFKVLFDHNGCIRRYEDITDVLREYFDVRLSLYQKRKDYMEGLLTAEANRLENIARFIMEKIDGLITIG